MSAFFDVLLRRQSVKFVQARGPTDEQLDLILQAALRAPDHGAVRPWRFVLVRGADVPALVDVGVRAGIAAGTPLPQPKVDNARKWLSKVPLAIALGCRPVPSGRSPEHEGLLAVGAAAMNMLNAAHSLGLGAFWGTGIGVYLDGVGEALGFDALDERFMGYLAIGTPIDTPDPVQRPDWRDHVSEWHAPAPA